MFNNLNHEWNLAMNNTCWMHYSPHIKKCTSLKAGTEQESSECLLNIGRWCRKIKLKGERKVEATPFLKQVKNQGKQIAIKGDYSKRNIWPCTLAPDHTWTVEHNAHLIHAAEHSARHTCATLWWSQCEVKAIKPLNKPYQCKVNEVKCCQALKCIREAVIVI